MAASLRNAKAFAIGKSGSLREDAPPSELHYATMAKKADDREPNHLKAWREFRHLTQEELGELAETTGSVISLLESGSRKLSPKWLRKLAPHLGTTPGFLLDHDPNDMDTAFVEAALSVPKHRREQALEILKTFKTGTDG